MGIDGIGKGKGLPPTQGPSGSTGAGAPNASEGTGKSFEVEAKQPTEATKAHATQATQTAGPTPLERLRAGEVNVHGYMNLKIDEATSHLHGLKKAELDAIRTTLREHMTSDPAIADLVKQATGQTPTVPED